MVLGRKKKVPTIFGTGKTVESYFIEDIVEEKGWVVAGQTIYYLRKNT